MAAFTTINPYTERQIASYPAAEPGDLDRALDRAAEAQRRHAATPPAARAERLHRLADALESGKRRAAEQMTAEMGKPVGQAEREVEKCASLCRYVARHAEGFLADEPRDSPAQTSLVAYRPLGVILAIMPWNFPFWQAVRAAVPALAAGNGVILKHASNVLGCGEALADLFETAGFGDGLFQHLVLTQDDVGTVIADGRIAGVTLTGSGRAGRAVAQQAGEALKPCVLELGGSDAFVVLADADLGAAAEAAVASRAQNNGESCIAAKRFILHQDIADAFTERFVAQMAALTVGDPMQDGTDLGPLARQDLRTETPHAGRARGLAGRAGAHRRYHPGRHRLLLSPDGARRRHAGHAAIRGGAVRPRGRAHRGARRGPRAGARERDALWPRRRGVYGGPRRAASGLRAGCRAARRSSTR